MAKLKEWITVISTIILNSKFISGQVEENTKLLMERMDSVEAAQELHGLKIELIQTEVTGLKKRVDSLEIKDQDILKDLGKLDRKFADLALSLTSQKDTSTKSWPNKPQKGIPTSCTDLKFLGHSLNGIYSVKKTQPNIIGTKIETVYCDFQSPTDSNGFETRIGMVDVKSTVVHFFVERKEINYGETGRNITFLKEVFNVGGGFD